MSAVSNVGLKECSIKLTRLTKEEIELHTRKSYNKTEKIADSKSDVKPKIFVRKDIQPTQDTEGTSNTGHEIMPDIIAPQNIQNDGINNEEINDTQVDDNVYAGFEDLMMPGMIYQQNVEYMDTTEGSANIDDPPTTSYIPNMITIKQEVHDETYDSNMLEVAGSSQIMIKQEIVDESYNYDNIMYSHDTSDYFVPDISNQPAQNFGFQTMKPEPSKPHVIVKQEVFDEGNIEVFTDVLITSEDQEYEDESPW